MLRDSEDAGENTEFTAPRDPVGVTASSVKPAIDFESQGYRDMIGRSLLNKGINVRLKRAIEKAKTANLLLLLILEAPLPKVLVQYLFIFKVTLIGRMNRSSLCLRFQKIVRFI